MHAQPFLPIVPPSNTSPIFVALLTPFSLAHAVVRGVLLGVVALLHVLLVDGVALAFVSVSVPSRQGIKGGDGAKSRGRGRCRGVGEGGRA